MMVVQTHRFPLSQTSSKRYVDTRWAWESLGEIKYQGQTNLQTKASLRASFGLSKI